MKLKTVATVITIIFLVAFAYEMFKKKEPSKTPVLPKPLDQFGRPINI